MLHWEAFLSLLEPGKGVSFYLEELSLDLSVSSFFLCLQGSRALQPSLGGDQDYSINICVCRPHPYLGLDWSVLVPSGISLGCPLGACYCIWLHSPHPRQASLGAGLPWVPATSPPLQTCAFLVSQQT